MDTEEYFEKLKARLFKYQTRFKILEPQADYFLAMLLENKAVQSRLSKNGVNVNTLNTMINMHMVLQDSVYQGSTIKLNDKRQVIRAPDPHPDSLSEIFKDADIRDAGITLIRHMFAKYVSESPLATRNVEKSLTALEENGATLNDLNLLTELLKSEEYLEGDSSLKHVLTSCGVTAARLAKDYKSPYADMDLAGPVLG